MEYVIAIFVGLWIASAGLFAYRQISADFANLCNEETAETEGTQK